MHGKKKRKQNMKTKHAIMQFILYDQARIAQEVQIACGDSVCRLSLRVQRVNDGLLSLILVVNCHLTKASIT